MGVTKKGKPCKKKVKKGGYCYLHITQEHKNTKECDISSSESPSPKKEKISKEEIEECKICYEPLYEKGETFVKKQTCCGKNVHISCLERWYKIRESCPFCRAISYSDNDSDIDSTYTLYDQYIDQWADVYPSYEEYLDFLDQYISKIDIYDE